ncbi:MAG: hypothetical protein GX117_05485 [Candidatus Hydrogenedentes bacterium]|jgi:hypothetical protein|nr:hypothetical protein [Candidatus Hydrogenedentota bacterium]
MINNMATIDNTIPERFLSDNNAWQLNANISVSSATPPPPSTQNFHSMMGSQPTVSLPRQYVEGNNLPNFLLKHCNISMETLSAALEEEKESGTFLGEILEQQKEFNGSKLVDYLTRYARLPFLNLNDYKLDRNLLKLFPSDFYKEHLLIPVDKLGLSVTVAMVNPLNEMAVHELSKLLPGIRVKRVICQYTDLLKCINTYFRPSRQLNHYTNMSKEH